MKIILWFGILWIGLVTNTVAQIAYTVPTAIIVENSAYTAPVYGATVDIIMKEYFDNNHRRPVSTRIGKYKTGKDGVITVSLQPNKSYTVTVACSGFFTQIAKINTQDFSRTRQNRKGVSLRPRNVLAIEGNIMVNKDIQILGQVALTNKQTEHTEVRKISADGSFFMKALQGSDYDLRVVVDGRLDTLIKLTELDLQGSTARYPYKIELKLDAPRPNYRKGDTLVLENMLFVGRTTKMQSEVWMDTLSSILLKTPTVRFKINVHTDARKSDRINYILAKKRLELIKEKLHERGISPSQYIFEAKGEDDIANQCEDGVKCTKEEHEINNRVVLIIASGQFLWNPEEKF